MIIVAEALTAFTLVLDDGRVCIWNNAAERSLRDIALRRKSLAVLRNRTRRPACSSHVQSDCDGDGVDPQACLADVLARIGRYPARRPDELIPWNWRQAAMARVPLAA